MSTPNPSLAGDAALAAPSSTKPALSTAAVLALHRKNWIALDTSLDGLGGPSVRAILEGNMTAAQLLDLLAEKGIEIRVMVTGESK